MLPGVVFEPIFAECRFENNSISSSGSEIVGLGTFIADTISIQVSRFTTFANNEGSALVLQSAHAKMADYLEFTRNQGDSGAAIKLFGFSWLTLYNQTTLIFSYNTARTYGGAIYCESSSSQSIISSRNCFLQYYNETERPGDWNVSFYFYRNRAGVEGQSIFATTLIHCVWGGSPSGTAVDPNQPLHNVLNWTNFHYLDEGSAPGYQIATTPRKLTFLNTSLKVAPSEQVNVPVAAIDDLGQSVAAVVLVIVEDDNKGRKSHSNPPLEIGSDQYQNVDNGKLSDLQMRGGTNRSGKVYLRTLDSRPLVASFDIQTTHCSRCYSLTRAGRCACVTDVPNENTNGGVSRCNNTENTCYLRRGFWAGYVSSDRFITHVCPFDFCKCTTGHGSTTGECVLPTTPGGEFDPDLQCNYNRTGRLCGACGPGLSILMGSNECQRCANRNGVIFASVVPFLLIAMVLFLIRVDFNAVSGHLNAVWFFYQVVLVVMPDKVYAEIANVMPYMIVIAVLNVRIPYGVCFFNGMDELRKVGVSFAIPGYCLLLIAVIQLIASRDSQIYRLVACGYPDRPSVLKTLCTLLVLSYTTVVASAFGLLTFTDVEGSGPLLYSDPTVMLWGKQHLPYGILALCAIITVAIPVPLFLVLAPTLQKKYALPSIKPLLDILHAPYADNRRQFAGFYFVGRLLLLAISVLEVVSSTMKQTLVQVCCLLFLVVHMAAQPYTAELHWINHVDAILLTILTVLSLLAAMPLSDEAQTSWARPVILILMAVPLVYLVLFIIYWILTHSKHVKKHAKLARFTAHLTQTMSRSVTQRLPTLDASGSDLENTDEVIADLLWHQSDETSPLVSEQSRSRTHSRSRSRQTGAVSPMVRYSSNSRTGSFNRGHMRDSGRGMAVDDNFKVND